MTQIAGIIWFLQFDVQAQGKLINFKCLFFPQGFLIVFFYIPEVVSVTFEHIGL